MRGRIYTALLPMAMLLVSTHPASALELGKSFGRHAPARVLKALRVGEQAPTVKGLVRELGGKGRGKLKRSTILESVRVLEELGAIKRVQTEQGELLAPVASDAHVWIVGAARRPTLEGNAKELKKMAGVAATLEPSPALKESVRQLALTLGSGYDQAGDLDRLTPNALEYVVGPRQRPFVAQGLHSATVRLIAGHVNLRATPNKSLAELLYSGPNQEMTRLAKHLALKIEINLLGRPDVTRPIFDELAHRVSETSVEVREYGHQKRVELGLGSNPVSQFSGRWKGELASSATPDDLRDLVGDLGAHVIEDARRATSPVKSR